MGPATVFAYNQRHFFSDIPPVPGALAENAPSAGAFAGVLSVARAEAAVSILKAPAALLFYDEFTQS